MLMRYDNASASGSSVELPQTMRVLVTYVVNNRRVPAPIIAEVRTKTGRFALEADRMRQDLPDASGYVVVTAPKYGKVPRLDGRPLQPIGDGTFVGDIVLVGDSSYHEVVVPAAGTIRPHVFGFCTDRAIQRLRFIRAVLEYVPHVAQVPERLFLLGALGGQRERSPGVVVGWLTERLHQLVGHLAAITSRPASPLTSVLEVQASSTEVAVSETRRLIRERPSVFRERENGLVTIHNARYSPEFVVDRRRISTTATHEHRQIVTLIAMVMKEIESLRVQDRLGPYRGEIEELESDLKLLLAKAPWRGLLRQQNTRLLRSHATALQQQDRRYSGVFGIMREYMSLSDYQPADDDLRTVLEGSPRIFQAFVAYVIADALGLKPVGSFITDRRNKASFIGSDLLLYYDVKPPRSVLRSWRDSSVLADRSRPDIIVHGPKVGTLVVDVKFKDYEDDGDLLSDIREMQVYHDSYRITRSVIACPFGTTKDVAGEDRAIRVLPIQPVPFDKQVELRKYLESQLAGYFNQH